MWFNTGVPLFFIISGFLMAQKKIDLNVNGIIIFYESRIKKLYLSYIVYILAISIVLILIGKPPTLTGVIMYLIGCPAFSVSGILGLGHLWFITVLLICYLQTPLLDYIKGRYNGSRRRDIWFWLLLILEFLLFFGVDKPAYGIHMVSYILGYRLGCRKWQCDSKTTIKWGFLAVFFSLVRLLLDTTVMAYDNKVYYYYDAIFQPIARLILAMWVFCVFIQHTEQIENWAMIHKKADWGITTFSAVSFEVYLTHQFIQLSVWKFIPHNGWIGMVVWVVLSIILTAINTIVLKQICLGIKRMTWCLSKKDGN